MHHGCYLVHCHGSGFVQSPCLLDLLPVEAYGAPARSAPCPCGFKACPGAFSYQVTFELGQAAEDVEDESATGRARVDRFRQRVELHSPGVELIDEFYQVLQGSSKPVEFLDDDGVAFA